MEDENITGKVQAVSDKGGKYGIKIADMWLNGIGAPPCDKGDYVSFRYKKNGIFNNVTEVEVKTKAEPTIQDRGFTINKTNMSDDRSVDIKRQVFIKIGAEIVKHQNIDDWNIEDITNQIFLIAKDMEKKFNNWDD